MEEKDIPKTAFSTESGHWEFLRCPFGMKNSPSTFQRVMDNILRGLQHEKCLVYLDDIIVFSTSLQEHIERLKEVFIRLRDANFKVQLNKSEFLRKEVSYLGHIVTPEGVKPNPEKISCIKNFPIPKTKKQIQEFLGLLGYYRKFIKDFAKLTKPLTHCLKKNNSINHENPEYIKCFDLCKNLLMNEPILQYPDFEKPFILTTDASNYAIGAVLSQGNIGSDLPIAYASRTLSDSETKYSTIEKELLAIVWATKHFRPYLYGTKFKIVCDHKPLIYLFSLKEPNSKLYRWRLKLEEYDYEIIYKKGHLNKNADALSRIKPEELNLNESDDVSPSYIFQYMKEFNESFDPNKPSTSKENIIENESIIVEVDDNDNQSQNSLPIIDDAEDDVTIHTNESDPIPGIPVIDCPINFGKNQIIISEINFEPSEPKIIKLFNNKMRILAQFSKNNFNNDVTNFIKEFISPKVKYHLYFEDPVYEKFSVVIQNNFKDGHINFVKCTKKLIDVADEDEILTTIQNYHEGKTNHRGLDETEANLKSLYYWPNQRKTIQNYINRCEICQKTKYDRKPLKLKFNATPTAIKPFQLVHIDTISLESVKFLTIVDSFSKYAQAYKLNSNQSIEVVNKLVRYFSHHGIPEQIVSDNGLEFKNSVFTELLELHKIKIHFTSTQHPESNSIVERFHSTLIEHIRLFNNQDIYKNDPIDTKVNYAILAYNNSIHSATKLRPYEIVTGHLENNSPFNLDLEKQILTNYISNHKEKVKTLYKNINNNIQHNKEKVISKLNENREDLPEIPKDVYVKNKQKQSKTKNKYKKETVKTKDTNLKTAKIVPSHYNTSEKIHLSNIKRPKKITSNTKNILGASTSDLEPK